MRCALLLGLLAPGAPVAAQELPQSLVTLVEELDEAGRATFDDTDPKIKTRLSELTEEEMVSSSEHLATLLGLNLEAQQFDHLLADNCVVCHSDPESQDGATFFTVWPAGEEPDDEDTHDLARFLRGAHFQPGLSCAGCHGGDPASTEMDHEFVEQWTEARSSGGWVPAFCGRCHSDREFMARFDPDLPTDQHAKYVTSPHGRSVLEKEDSSAAQCVSCHGVHGIQGAKNPSSPVHPKNVPATCGHCHASPETMAGITMRDGTPIPTNQLEQYRKSVHGKALLEEGDLGAPACNDCHGNHSGLHEDKHTADLSCRGCHPLNGELFDGSHHQKAFAEHGWSQCGTCHENHEIVRPNDSWLLPLKGSLCFDCHQEYAPDNPECKEGAAHFHETLTSLSTTSAQFHRDIEYLAKLGLDPDPLSTTTTALDDALRRARSHIHSFDKHRFDQVAGDAHAAAKEGAEIMEAAEVERAWRLNGLLVSIAMVGLVLVTMGLKLRQLERS